MLARIRADKQGVEDDEAEEDEAPERDDATNRVVVKFFWVQLGKLTDPNEWTGRHGVISVIRRRMGAGAPSNHACKRTLVRLTEDENDDVSQRVTGGGRPQREFSDADDLYVGLLLCEGHSQRSATFLINGERSAQGLPPVSKQVIMDAEARVQLLRRRRRTVAARTSQALPTWRARGARLASRLRCRSSCSLRPVVAVGVDRDGGATACLRQPGENKVLTWPNQTPAWLGFACMNSSREHGKPRSASAVAGARGICIHRVSMPET